MGYIVEYQVRLKKKVEKKLLQLPKVVQERLVALIHVLRQDGPTGPYTWPNYGKFRGRDHDFHCHLTGDHAWVACWTFEKEILTIEVYYAGSHQNAPY